MTEEIAPNTQVVVRGTLLATFLRDNGDGTATVDLGYNVREYTLPKSQLTPLA